MKVFLSLALVVAVLSAPSLVYAGSCVTVSGGPANASVVVPSTTILENNVAGATLDITPTPNTNSTPVVCTCNSDQPARVPGLYDWASFSPALTTEESGGKTYAIINDYLEVAAQPLGTVNPEAKWIPYSAVHQATKSYVCNSQTPASGGVGVITLRIRTPFVGLVDIPSTLLYTKGANTAELDVQRDPEINFYLSGSIHVPQSCELNTGQVISMDFGDIGASAFPQAGAGNKPAGVNPQTRDIAIKCKNIDAQAMLSMRIEASNTSGNAIISDNPDLGFVVADGKQSPLEPNNIDSKIPFRLDDNASAKVPISAWPVSITGNKPAEGKFTSEGYLRVDFD